MGIIPQCYYIIALNKVYYGVTFSLFSLESCPLFPLAKNLSRQRYALYNRDGLTTDLIIFPNYQKVDRPFNLSLFP